MYILPQFVFYFTIPPAYRSDGFHHFRYEKPIKYYLSKIVGFTWKLTFQCVFPNRGKYEDNNKRSAPYLQSGNLKAFITLISASFKCHLKDIISQIIFLSIKYFYFSSNFLFIQSQWSLTVSHNCILWIMNFGVV